MAIIRQTETYTHTHNNCAYDDSIHFYSFVCLSVCLFVCKLDKRTKMTINKHIVIVIINVINWHLTNENVTLYCVTKQYKHWLFVMFVSNDTHTHAHRKITWKPKAEFIELVQISNLIILMIMIAIRKKTKQNKKKKWSRNVIQNHETATKWLFSDCNCEFWFEINHRSCHRNFLLSLFWH